MDLKYQKKKILKIKPSSDLTMPLSCVSIASTPISSIILLTFFPPEPMIAFTFSSLTYKQHGERIHYMLQFINFNLPSNIMSSIGDKQTFMMWINGAYFESLFKGGGEHFNISAELSNIKEEKNSLKW